MSFVTREDKSERCTAATVGLPPKAKDQHTMAMRSLNKLVKPLLRIIKKKQSLKKTLAEIQEQNAYNSSLEDMRKDAAAAASSANDDNLANEVLEQRIYDEIRRCPENAAIIVQQGQQKRVMPVHPQQLYIPVHFARTVSGTFFWTSMDVTRQQELQLRACLDRWGQA